MPHVSVIIPTWNRATLLESAVRSVLAQTFESLEVLICDDASTDNTLEVVRSISDERVRLVAGLRGKRPAIPRNRGICASKGEWLAFLDDDDQWLPTKLQKQLSLSASTGCRAICTDALRLMPGGEVSGRYLGLSRELIGFEELLRVNLVICSSAVIHRSLLPVVFGFPEDEALASLEDYALWLRVATETHFAFVAEPLVIYSDQPEHSIRSNSVGPWEQRCRVLTDFMQWHTSKTWSSIFWKARLHYYWALFNYLASERSQHLR